MLHSVNDLLGEKIHSTNDDFGIVKEFLFDDEHWNILYMVVDTGHLLPGKNVLISPDAFDDQDWESRKFSVKLSKEQILECPDISEHLPVKRSHEKECTEHYGDNIYWAAGPVIVSAYEVEPELNEYHCEDHLRSTNEVNGYTVHADDGDIGHVEDFMIDDSSWKIRYVLIHTGKWLPSKKVLFSPTWINKYSCRERKISMSLLRDEIKNSPAYHGLNALKRDYENELFAHYGKSNYWE